MSSGANRRCIAAACEAYLSDPGRFLTHAITRQYVDNLPDTKLKANRAKDGPHVTDDDDDDDDVWYVLCTSLFELQTVAACELNSQATELFWCELIDCHYAKSPVKLHGTFFSSLRRSN